MDAEELFRACLDACDALSRAFDGLVRRNVEAVCRHYNIEDQALVDEMVRRTLEAIHHRR